MENLMFPCMALNGYGDGDGKEYIKWVFSHCTEDIGYCASRKSHHSTSNTILRLL